MGKISATLGVNVDENENFEEKSEEKESHWAAVYRMNKPIMGMALAVAALLALVFILGTVFT